jgi:hypothetical protein
VGGGIPAYSIARWDGGQWHALGDGIGSGVPWDYQYVFALATYEDDVVAAGNFVLAGGEPASRIARWNGADWGTLGSGLHNEAFALQVSAGELFVGGHFGYAGGKSSTNIARWMGESADVPPSVSADELMLTAPNPFCPGQAVLLSGPALRGTSVDILDVTGRRIRTLTSSSARGGRCRLIWDGCETSGLRAAPGVYYLRARAGAGARTRAVILVE